MTGFGGKAAKVALLGKVSVELRSTNHKFLEIVTHLPEGFLSLEERIKREIEGRLRRGRITCVVNIAGLEGSGVLINKPLLKNYLTALHGVKRQFGIRDELSINTLVHLPGVLSLAEGKSAKADIWPALRPILAEALGSLCKMRQKEGRSTAVFLKKKTEGLSLALKTVRAKFRKVIQRRLAKINIDEERAAFLKDADITEEMERLAFHIRNFQNKLTKNGAVGKELDFIAQEMQREANTMAAKSIDPAVSAKVVQIKSAIEKIREQVQNIE
jgi:uncharacterized protein (TIGR00255 family)